MALIDSVSSPVDFQADFVALPVTLRHFGLALTHFLLLTCNHFRSPLGHFLSTFNHFRTTLRHFRLQFGGKFKKWTRMRFVHLPVRVSCNFRMQGKRGCFVFHPDFSHPANFTTSKHGINMYSTSDYGWRAPEPTKLISYSCLWCTTQET